MADEPAQTREPKIVGDVKLIKADDGAPRGDAIRARGWEFEDEFEGKYGPIASGQGTSDVEIIEPPYLPRTLEALCLQNNTLNVCVDAMVTNVHGTGFDIKVKDDADEIEDGEETTEVTDPNAPNDPLLNDGEDEEDEEEEDPDAEPIAQIKAFFDEVYPGESFLDLRKAVGRDLEKTGNAYIEVIRNLAKQIIFLRRLDPKMMRLIKLSEPKLSSVTVTRNGKTFDAQVLLRWRRFVQTLNGTKMLYFKEFGCPDEVDCDSGRWASDGITLPANQRASEIIHIKRDDDCNTPYGVPAWISQTPSVLGSRRAEEHNLDFFDHGGVPPMMVFVNGGQLTPAAAAALRQHLQGGNNKHTIPVIETVSTGGSMDSPGQVRVTVERFGSERQDDSMFEKYDERCEKRVRRAWRLPPLFVGATDDYNFASAYASYLAAEAQVFAPERQEFDALINRTIMKELDPTGRYEFVSRPITLKDVDKQLAALQMAMDNNAIGGEQLVQTINNITSLDLRYEEQEEEDIGFGELGLPDPNAPPGGGGEFEDPNGDLEDGADPSLPAMKSKPDIAALAVAAYKMFNNGGSRDDLNTLLGQLQKLSKKDRALFRKTLTDMALEGGQGGQHSAQLLTHAVLTTLNAAP